MMRSGLVGFLLGVPVVWIALAGLLSARAYADMDINGVSIDDYAKNASGTRYTMSDLGFVLNEDTKKGRYLTSVDGRYVIVGDIRIYDRFARTQPTSIEQVKTSRLFFKLSDLGVNKDDFVLGSYGDEKKQTLVFSDPGDDAYLGVMTSLKRMVDAQKIAGLGLVIVGKSDETRQRAMEVYCAFKGDRDSSMRKVLDGALPEKKVCVTGVDYVKGQLISVFAGGGQFPVAITPEGRVYAGEAFNRWIQ